MQLSLNVLHNEVLIYSPLICTKFKLRRIEVIVRLKFKHTFAIMDMLNMKKIYVHF